MGAEMFGQTPWSWTESLGGLRPSPIHRYRVGGVVFGLVRDRCLELGIDEGVHIRCLRRTRELVTIELPDGTLRDVELACAWFVPVEPVTEEVPMNAA
jgi:hypothetical protein